MEVHPIYLEFCKKVRPEWTLQDGTTSTFIEFFHAANDPFGLVWLISIALFIWKRTIPTSALFWACSLLLWMSITSRYELIDDLHYG